MRASQQILIFSFAIFLTGLGARSEETRGKEEVLKEFFKDCEERSKKSKEPPADPKSYCRCRYENSAAFLQVNEIQLLKELYTKSREGKGENLLSEFESKHPFLIKFEIETQNRCYEDPTWRIPPKNYKGPK
jgi:hypothetical protein